MYVVGTYIFLNLFIASLLAAQPIKMHYAFAPPQSILMSHTRVVFRHANILS